MTPKEQIREIVNEAQEPKFNISTDKDIYFKLSMNDMKEIVEEYQKDTKKNIDQIIYNIVNPTPKVQDLKAKQSQLNTQIQDAKIQLEIERITANNLIQQQDNQEAYIQKLLNIVLKDQSLINKIEAEMGISITPSTSISSTIKHQHKSQQLIKDYLLAHPDIQKLYNGEQQLNVYVNEHNLTLTNISELESQINDLGQQQQNIEQQLQKAKQLAEQEYNDRFKIYYTRDNEQQNICCTMIIGQNRYEKITLEDLTILFYQAQFNDADLGKTITKIHDLRNKKIPIQKELGTIQKDIDFYKKEIANKKSMFTQCCNSIIHLQHERCQHTAKDHDQQKIYSLKQSICNDKQFIDQIEFETGIDITNPNFNLHKLIKQSTNINLKQMIDNEPKLQEIYQAEQYYSGQYKNLLPIDSIDKFEKQYQQSRENIRHKLEILTKEQQASIARKKSLTDTLAQIEKEQQQLAPKTQITKSIVTTF